MTMNKTMSTLRFQGSVWCNLDVALRNMDQVFGQAVQPAELTVIEWYILRALYEEDGQHASELARAVGRAATSFTPNLDKLQKKGLIERRADPSDRRAVRIYLTDAGHDCKQDVLDSARRIDRQIAEMFSEEEYDNFQQTLAALQNLNLD